MGSYRGDVSRADVLLSVQSRPQLQLQLLLVLVGVQQLVVTAVQLSLQLFYLGEGGARRQQREEDMLQALARVYSVGLLVWALQNTSNQIDTGNVHLHTSPHCWRTMRNVYENVRLLLYFKFSFTHSLTHSLTHSHTHTLSLTHTHTQTPFL